MCEIDILYTGSRQSAEYIQYYLSQKDKELDIRIIKITKIRKKMHKFPWKIARLMLLEFPSLIIIERTSQKPIVNIEFSGRKPMGYNHSQFFARIYQSGRCKIPFLFIYPSRAFQVRRSEGGRSAIEYDSPIYIKGLINANKIFGVPILAFNWDMDIKGEMSNIVHGSLLLDENFTQMPDSNSPDLNLLFDYLERQIREFANGTLDYFNWDETNKALEKMKLLKDQLESRSLVNREFRYDYYTSDDFISFIINKYEIKEHNIPERFLKKPTIVHENGSKTIRSDPYVGLYALYDLTFCRNPDNLNDKYNLVAFWSNKELSKELATRKFKGYYKENWNNDLSIELKAWLDSNQKIGRCLTYFLDGFLLNDGLFWKSCINQPLFMNEPKWDIVDLNLPTKLDIDNTISIDTIDEEDIAFSVRDLLLNNGWKLLSFNPPRGIRHVDLLSQNSGIVRAFGARIPDIIAYKNNGLIILEFKVDLDRNDIDKLLNISKSDLEILKEEYNLPPDFKLLKGIGISHFEVHYYEDVVIPSEIATFIVDEYNRKTTLFWKNEVYNQFLNDLPKFLG